jgi:hypothetical protein
MRCLSKLAKTLSKQRFYVEGFIEIRQQIYKKLNIVIMSISMYFILNSANNPLVCGQMKKMKENTAAVKIFLIF